MHALTTRRMGLWEWRQSYGQRPAGSWKPGSLSSSGLASIT